MIYRIISKVERICAELQGKGWGANTIKQEVKVLNKLLKNPALAIDIGANVGDYSIALQNAFRNIEIHLFEPSKVNYQKLLNRFNDKKVIINPLAVSNTNGVANLYSNVPGSALASLTKREYLNFENIEEVKTITFEHYWKQELFMKDIDLIKIDVEGHELDVLEGLGKAIFRTKIIQFEFGACNIDTGTYFRNFWQFFKEHNFEIYRITPLGLQHIAFYNAFDDFFHTTNFICVNSNK
ncbi:FkbM family methyltransferase [Mucilaginibacter phyllosphaerae]